MGRMKDVYIDIMQKYNHIPKDFNLGEYLHKKQIEDAEWKEHQENMQSQKKDCIRKHDKNGDCK